MTEKQSQKRAIITLGGLLILGYISMRYFGSRRHTISQELLVENQMGSIATGGSVPGQYPEGYTGGCTGCEVVSGVVLDSYLDIFTEGVVKPLTD